MSNEILTTGKRKTATARAVTKKGKGKVLINGVPVELYPIELLRNKLMEPLKILGERSNEVDIDIKVNLRLTVSFFCNSTCLHVNHPEFWIFPLL